ncbi:MAG: RDD family protein [Bacteroidales bacterium]|nr:RDD family protein [Bacteroidales bacterium]
MEKIDIQTSQNVVIEQPVASIGERFLAHLLDYIFFLGYFILISLFTSKYYSSMGLLYTLFFLPVFFYDLICELSMGGQSWGKKIVKIKVVKTDGTELGFFSCFIRWIFRIVENLLLFGSVSTLSIIINGKGQRLGDMAANTAVIRIKNNHFKDTLYTEVPENYEARFPEAANLSSEDVYTIKEVLDYCLKNQYVGKAAVMLTAAKTSFEKKLMVKSDLNPREFLDTLVRDYNALHKA